MNWGRIIEGVLTAGSLGGLGGYMVWGALNKLNSGEKAVEGAWDGNSFATLGWIAILLLAVVTVRAVRERDESVARLLGVGIGGQLLFAAGVACVSLAWAAERQNYWDAYHFSVLVWDAFLGAIVGLVCVVMAAKRGSIPAQFLIGLATFWVLCALGAWTWTWSSTVQGWEADITRSFYLATHE